jgi:hypothetical protein
MGGVTGGDGGVALGVEGVALGVEGVTLGVMGGGRGVGVVIGTILGTGTIGGGITSTDGGGNNGSSVLIKVLMLGFIGTTVLGGETLMSAPLQPSGKKYLMFWLRCSSSLKSPTKDAFLKPKN